MAQREELPARVEGPRFVSMTGSPVFIGNHEEWWRLREVVADVRIAIDGLMAQPQDRKEDALRFLARQCSIFLRKMVLGDRWTPPLLSAETCQAAGLKFDRVRAIPAENRRVINLAPPEIAFGVLRIKRLNEKTLEPEAEYVAPAGPQRLRFDLEWPLLGMSDWIEQPTPQSPWCIEPGGLFNLNSNIGIDCDQWLGQQVARINDRSVTLGEIIAMVANTEGAHAPPMDRLMQPEGSEDKSRSQMVKNNELYILGHITAFNLRYAHSIVILAGLRLYYALTHGHLSEQLGGVGFIPVLKVAVPDVFSVNQQWLRFSGSLAISFSEAGQSISYAIKAPRPRRN